MDCGDGGDSSAAGLVPDIALLGIPACDDAATAATLLEGVAQLDRWEAHIAWCRYTHASGIFHVASDEDPELDERVLDDFARTAAQLATLCKTSPAAGDTMLREALAMAYRIPCIGDCLRDGVISPRQFKKLVIRTDLIDGMPYGPEVDADIAGQLRRRGVWSDPRLRDMVDRMICRYDPESVRRRHEAAKKQRSCWSVSGEDGMGEIGITATTEDIALAFAAVEALAESVCKRDPRTKRARRSDAAICRMQEAAFECQCDQQGCDATIGEQALSDKSARIVVHVICTDSTLRGDGGNGGPTDSGPGDGAPTDRVPSDDGPDDYGPFEPDPAAENSARPGFVDGYGVIPAAHVRDIAARPDAVIRPINPLPGHPLPSHLPSDGYRPSTALDTFVRARDGYCVFPGCPRRAWDGDVDHVAEYDHSDPAAGGKTIALNLNVKCRFHHLLKTFGNWLDDQYLAPDGHTHTTITSPAGLTVHGHGHTNEDLFPALADIQFRQPDPPRSQRPPPEQSGKVREGPQRRRSRSVDKHARRRLERKKNREDMSRAYPGSRLDPPPF